VKLTTHLHLVPSSKNDGSYTSTPQYAFMAWCSVKAQGQLYLFFKRMSLSIGLLRACALSLYLQEGHRASPRNVMLIHTVVATCSQIRYSRSNFLCKLSRRAPSRNFSACSRRTARHGPPQPMPRGCTDDIS
jgi:hypothetical protein